MTISQINISTIPGRRCPVLCVDRAEVDKVDAGRYELDAEEPVPGVPGLHVQPDLRATWHVPQHEEAALVEQPVGQLGLQFQARFSGIFAAVTEAHTRDGHCVCVCTEI